MRKNLILALLSLFFTITSVTAHAAVTTQEFGTVKIHTYSTSGGLNGAIVEN